MNRFVVNSLPALGRSLRTYSTAPTSSFMNDFIKLSERGPVELAIEEKVASFYLCFLTLDGIKIHRVSFPSFD